MKNKQKKKRLYERYQCQFTRLTAIEQMWLNMAPVGREFGSKDYERWRLLDNLDFAVTQGEIVPGEILLKEFILPRGLTVEQVAGSLGLPLSRMMDLVHGSHPITNDIAVHLGSFFDMDAGFWLNLQADYDKRMKVAMKGSLFDTLYDRYPLMFPQRPIRLGIACGEGWFTLVDNLCKLIQQYIDQNDAQQIIVEQIKEKFGKLRFYYRNGDTQIGQLVNAAKDKSITICEVCGGIGSLNPNERIWWRTRCEKHVDTRV